MTGITPRAYLGLILAVLLVAGCDNLLGSKQDGTTDEIFEAGRTDPGFLEEAEYVPLFPFFEESANGGGFNEPKDVYVGYDELLYVVDADGLHIIDIAGRPAGFVPIPGGATTVIQDRQFNVFVTARRDTVVGNQSWSLPVVLKYSDVTTGLPRLTQTIWHPFDDDSRKFNLPDPLPEDEEVEFTGVAFLYNNNMYVSRKGPLNLIGSVLIPHNAVLEFTPEGQNVQAVPLNPRQQNLRSVINPSAVVTTVQPPQRESFSVSKNFVVAQSGIVSEQLRFAVLSILAVETTDGIVYLPDSEKLSVASDTSRGNGFLYEEFKFENPADITIAGDNTQYLFVIDSAKDSLFIFTSNGIEGVAPPPGSNSTKPVVVSFGGSGTNARQFNNPSGVAYGRRIVYVADTGNNRISRFRLNTDFE